MPHALHFASVDLGAESGRVMLGRFDGERLALDEAHRFDSRPVRVPDGLHTDVLRIFGEVRLGLAKAARAAGGALAGIAVDSWGVDFALVDREGTLLGNPYHYRDGFSERATDAVFRRRSREQVFQRTGTAFLPINTLFQLMGLKLRGAAALAAAERLLMIPDLFNHWLCGEARNELTIASTTQLLCARSPAWALDLVAELGLPARIFGELVPPGTVVGELLRSLADDAGVARVPLVAAGGHDTALAVAGVPAEAPGFAYLSSGTWSLLGAELAAPCLDPGAFVANFTNERGVAGTTRFLKNIAGLWIVQECRRHWAREGQAPSYDELARLAAESRPWRSLIDPDDPAFAAPGEMPKHLRDYCAATRQPMPGTQGELVRCALDSLALKYRLVLGEMERVLGRRLDPLHVVGGGSRNALLCQLTADATGRLVLAGPVEATAAGSVAMQAVATGRLGSLADARAVVRRSFELTRYEPRETAALEDAWARFLALPRLSSGESE